MWKRIRKRKRRTHRFPPPLADISNNNAVPNYYQVVKDSTYRERRTCCQFGNQTWFTSKSSIYFNDPSKSLEIIICHLYPVISCVYFESRRMLLLIAHVDVYYELLWGS